jgi:hypothetical protein
MSTLVLRTDAVAILLFAASFALVGAIAFSF